jgi:outer membrane protein OmpA-like peptidoglycan-associated protein
MSKLSQLSFVLLFTLPVLAGCKTDKAPSSESTMTNPGAGMDSGYINNPTRPDHGNQGPIIPIGPSETLNNLPTHPDASAGNIDFDHPAADMLLATVHFDFDSINIKAADRPALEAAAKKIAANPNLQIVAVGHTDWIGSDEYNLSLSERRANSTQSYLDKVGANKAQIQILARGKFGSTADVKRTSPQAINDRRVDVIVIPAGTALPTSLPTTSTTPDTATTPGATPAPAASSGVPAS